MRDEDGVPRMKPGDIFLFHHKEAWRWPELNWPRVGIYMGRAYGDHGEPSAMVYWGDEGVMTYGFAAWGSIEII